MKDDLFLRTTLETAEQFRKNGDFQKATEILVPLVSANSGAVAAEALFALARISYDLRSWKEAADLFQAFLESVPDDLEGLVKSAHCFVELGDLTGASALATRLRATNLQRPGLSRSENEELLRPIYQAIALHCYQDEVDQAMSLVSIAGALDSYVADVLDCSPVRGPSRALTDGEIRKRMAEANQRWEEGPQTVPYLERIAPDLRPIDATLDRARGKKLLMVFRRTFLWTADSREHELTFFFRHTAEKMGMSLTFFPAEAFLNPRAISPAEQHSELDRLLNRILSLQPDIVVFDELCMRSAGGDYLTPEQFTRALSEIKSKVGFRLVAFYPDGWFAEGPAIFELVQTFADVLWHQNWSLPRSIQSAPRSKVFLGPVPYSADLFQHESVVKDIDAAFIGGLFLYNYPRAVWLTLLKARRLPCEIFLSGHSQTSSPAGASVEEYARFLARVKITVNFTARTPAKKIMTGRAWEAILARSLLLEEEEKSFPNYFVPFVHYVPFKNITELSAYLDFFRRQEGARQKMVERALNWYREKYSYQQIWNVLLALTGVG